MDYNKIKWKKKSFKNVGKEDLKKKQGRKNKHE